MRKNVLIVALVLLVSLVGCADHEHAWGEWKTVKEPTCTEAGSKTRTCIGCNEVETEELPALGHKWDDGKITTEATCENEGVKTFTCTVCNATRTVTIEKVEHNLDENYKCSMCRNYFYPSLSEFNSKVTLENSEKVVVTVNLSDEKFGDIEYKEHETNYYTGKGLWIGRAFGDNPLNKYGATPAEKGIYKYIFRGGRITSAANGFSEFIGAPTDTAVYMMLPGNADVVFEDVTFEGVFSFVVQMYTIPWSYLNSVEFKNCTFNGIIAEDGCPSEKLVFDGCTFNNYTNESYANNSNPIWMRAGAGYWGEGSDESITSMQEIVFMNNTVVGTRPVKFEYVGINSASGYKAVMKFFDNDFDIISQEDDVDMKNVAISIGNKDAFDLYDDGNKISEGTRVLYSSSLSKSSNEYKSIKGTRVLDREGSPKIIKCLEWKKGTDYEMKSID